VLTGHCKTVEFTFDMREDTADCIAKEMMDDLSLSEDEAAKIAKKIKEEIGRLVSDWLLFSWAKLVSYTLSDTLECNFQAWMMHRGAAAGGLGGLVCSTPHAR
jgi:hypothetical protein